MRQPLKRKITAILAADIAEYTRLTAEDEEETLSRLEAYRMVFDDLVVRAGGRVFNSAGDSVMCEFASAVEATRCAIDIQESFRTRNLAYPVHRQMHFRIGISIGDVVERDGDLLGDVVNIAARLQSLAEPGSICVSRSVQEAVANKTSMPSLDMGHREVKNLPYPVHVFKIDVNRPAGAPGRRGKTPGSSPKASRPAALWMLGGLLVATGAAALVSVYQWRGTGRTDVTTAPAADPTRPAQDAIAPARDTPGVAERYRTARLLEVRGESAAARRDYVALASLGSDFIDPALRLASLIRTEEGHAAARSALAELSDGRSRAVQLAYALQFDGAERLQRLEALAAAHPDFAPLDYLIAAELGDARRDAQTIADKRRENAALERFLSADREGALVRFVLDQALLGPWLERARDRQASIATFFAQGRDRISVGFTPTNNGWAGTITLPEPAIDVKYRLGDDGPFRSTGLLQAIDPRTGRPMPKPSIAFPHQTAALDIALRYVDGAGVSSPVTTIAFEPGRALQRSMRDTVEGIALSWLAYGSGQNSDRAYLTTLISYRCALDKVEIGFNGQAPREVFPLPPCDPEKPIGVPVDARHFVRLAPSVESVTVRLTFIGGDMSEVAAFPRPARR